MNDLSGGSRRDEGTTEQFGVFKDFDFLEYESESVEVCISYYREEVLSYYHTNNNVTDLEWRKKSILLWGNGYFLFVELEKIVHGQVCKFVIKLCNVNSWNHIERATIWLHAFLTSTSQLHALATLHPGKNPGTHWIVSLGILEKDKMSFLCQGLNHSSSTSWHSHCADCGLMAAANKVG